MQWERPVEGWVTESSACSLRSLSLFLLSSAACMQVSGPTNCNLTFWNQMLKLKFDSNLGLKNARMYMQMQTQETTWKVPNSKFWVHLTRNWECGVRDWGLQLRYKCFLFISYLVYLQIHLQLLKSASILASVLITRGAYTACTGM